MKVLSAVKSYFLILVLLSPFNLFGQWEKTSLPLNVEVGNFFIMGSTVIAGSTKNGVYFSEDNGTTWTQSTNLKLSSVQGFSLKGDKLFAGTNGMGVVVSTDRGMTWTEKNNGLPSYPSASTALCGNTLLAIVFNSGIYRSTDEGESWTMTTGTVPNSSLFYHMTIIGNKIFASQNMKDLYCSEDEGLTWNVIKLPGTNPILWKVFSNNNVLYVYLLKDRQFCTLSSTDNGTTWTQISILGVSDITNIGQSLLANGLRGSIPGVYMFSLSDTSTFNISQGLPELPSVMALANNGQYVFASVQSNAVSTDKNGVYRIAVSQITTDVKAGGAIKPEGFSLGQNYPNPFNPSTRITYSLAKESHVRLAVYNLLGGEVASLANEVQKAGTYSVNFNGGGLPSGTYFYRIDAGGFSQARKFVLMK